MDLSTWLLFVVTEAALCVSPGPAVLYVVSQGLSRGQRAAFVANLGILTGNGIYYLASALGLGALILASHGLFLAVKWLGVVYLVWLGLRMLLGAASVAEAEAQAQAQTAPRVPAGRVYRGGVILQLANPKNLVFFLAILPPFIDPAGNVPLQMLILGVTSLVIEVCALLCYGAAASGAGRWVRAAGFTAWLDRAAGSLLIMVGAGLAFVRRADP